MSTLPNNQYDAIEWLIFEEKLHIETIDIHPELDLMIVILNTKAVLHQNLSSYKQLQNAPKEKLLQYELIGGGIGIHWPSLDEDLSLKGFLQDELRKLARTGKGALAA
ncbi:MAG: DUF2442 domain-containing protein [Chitinophagaceae bacterium]